MIDFQLRPVTAEDAAFLQHLMNHPSLMARLHQPATTLTDWQEAISLWHSDPDEEGFIVMIADQPIGWFAVNGLQSPERIPYIKMAALLPPRQNSGIGRCVIQQLCNSLQKAGFPAVRLFVDCDNTPALRCYQRCGFHVLGTEEQSWPDGTTLMQFEMEKVF